ncbi:DUF262 domain-containing protein [Corynebacterium sp. HS2168-gen11]|uniref:GmrSD restriction endonuclease domain-containing protein n=1 Tax=Corynebacterium sp. HS2168-gen11 TaxID=2974027 RepID=UPI00216B28C9|nr:DUF262 domain-containing protein [Corynebacterium sp. HS2168-gen11]MCS4534823.1 DUF262 domain-containing protein [Corynebacterium sp. HS2168-gen11]
MGFSTPSYDLLDLFNRVDRGDLQLPDFQREFCWDVDRIRSLVITVLRGYPIGSIMALDTRNEPVRFRPRPLSGAPLTTEPPGLLLLDGQQRMTTLYHCLKGTGLVESVDFRQKKVKRRFFVDVQKAISADVLPDEAVIAVDERGVIQSHFAPQIDLSSREAALQNGYIPVSDLLFDAGTDLLFDIAASSSHDIAKKFYTRVVKPLVRYSVPMIRLDRTTSRAGIGSIFASVNTLGLQMDVFELLTAVFAVEDPDFRLQDDWEKTAATLREHPALAHITRTDFLSAVALYVTHKKGHASGFRETVLDLTLAEYIPAAEKIRAGFVEVATFLHTRYIHSAEQIPYVAQLVPLAVIITVLTEDGVSLEHQSAWDRINRWFWCGVFGELYGSPAVMARTGSDVDEVTAWVRDIHGHAGVPIPRSISQARFVESRLHTALPNSGLYKGIYALLMARGAQDWRTGLRFDAQTFFELGTKVRKIFPASWCEDNNIEPFLEESVLNQTPMSRRTYVMVEGSSPARYLHRIQSKSLLDDEEFDQILHTHLIEPSLLLSARAQEFFTDRRRKFVEIIEQAMGQPAVHDVDESNLFGGEEGPSAFVRS